MHKLLLSFNIFQKFSKLMLKWSSSSTSVYVNYLNICFSNKLCLSKILEISLI